MTGPATPAPGSWSSMSDLVVALGSARGASSAGRRSCRRRSGAASACWTRPRGSSRRARPGARPRPCRRRAAGAAATQRRRRGGAAQQQPCLKGPHLGAFGTSRAGRPSRGARSWTDWRTLRLAPTVRRALLLSLVLALAAPGTAAARDFPQGLPLGHGDRRLPDRGRRAARQRRSAQRLVGLEPRPGQHRRRVMSAATASSAVPVTGACTAATPRLARTGSARTPSASRSSGAGCSRARPAARARRASSTGSSTRRRPATTPPSCARSGAAG